MVYKIEATTTRGGNLLTFKVYERKMFLIVPYWKFMCNQGSLNDAERLVRNLHKINEGNFA